jgi:hypothetical protein
VIASLVETCKLCGVDPQAYLADVLTRIVDGHLCEFRRNPARDSNLMSATVPI